MAFLEVKDIYKSFGKTDVLKEYEYHFEHKFYEKYFVGNKIENQS